jgi:Ubiquitin carboxyl-terminal hydrolases
LALVGDKKELAEREISRLKLIRAALQKSLGQEPTDMIDDSANFETV